MGNVVTIQTASVQEQLQRIQQLREQQQQKKKQAAEAKRENTPHAASHLIQKQVPGPGGVGGIRDVGGCNVSGWAGVVFVFFFCPIFICMC